MKIHTFSRNYGYFKIGLIFADVKGGTHPKACTGPAEYCGFCELTDDGGQFISETEGVKKNRRLAWQYYQEYLKSIHSPKEKYLYVEPIEIINNNMTIEVVNYFPDLKSLASLIVLSNYDREGNTESPCHTS